MTNTPTNAEIRQFISKYFSESELDTFCFDYFPEVMGDFASEMPLNKPVMRVIGYCEWRDLAKNLLVNLQKERPEPYKQTFSTRPVALPSAPQSTKRIEVVEEYVQKPNVLMPPMQTKANRFGHGKTGLEFVRIPASDFLYGEKKETLYLPEYWISKTPVTQKIYKRFIDANPKHDVPSGISSYKWNKRKRTFPAEKADHPVVFVSWRDAVAFAEWFDLQLPTEQQWEKAARGVDGREYPWGNDWRENYCNTSEESSIMTSGTRPVGSYSPQGDSPFGCIDMSGNIWEWTSSLYKPHFEDRIVRGGSWYFNGMLARVTATGYFHPDYSDRNVGFRLVSSVFNS